MNATPLNLNPANAVQVQPAAGKQQDSATQDVPFSQVLSSEIAQKRGSSEAKEDTDTTADAGDGSQAVAPTTPGTDSTAAAAKITDAGKAKRDPLLDESTAATPDLLFALAIHPDMLKPAPAGTDGALPEQLAASATSTTIAPDARKGRAPLALQAGEFAEDATDKQKIDPARPGKADFRAAVVATNSANASAAANANAAPTDAPGANAATPAMAAATAAAAVEQAAARKADVIKTGELLPDLMNNPAVRTSPHVAPPTLDSAGANKLTPSVGTAAWNQALGEKIVWMAAGAQQTAALTLNPPNMGPLQIVLNVSNDQATASFFSAQPEVRQALEAAFPKLREMMNEAGIQLGQATVSADTPRQNDTPERQAQWLHPAFAGAENASAADLQAGHAPVQQSGRGLVDTFA